MTIRDYTTMVDIITDGNTCLGILAREKDGAYRAIEAGNTILASGGIGGLYDHSTNFPHLTGDALAIAMRHGIALENIDYVRSIRHPFIRTVRGGVSSFPNRSAAKGRNCGGKTASALPMKFCPAI